MFSAKPKILKQEPKYIFSKFCNFEMNWGQHTIVLPPYCRTVACAVCAQNNWPHENLMSCCTMSVPRFIIGACWKMLLTCVTNLQIQNIFRDFFSVRPGNYCPAETLLFVIMSGESHTVLERLVSFKALSAFLSKLYMVIMELFLIRGINSD